MAAEQGVADAQYLVALMYSLGRGVQQDYVQAHMWFSLAGSRLTGETREMAVNNRDLAEDELFLGVAVEIPAEMEVSYVGTEHIGPEDTCDADYGRLLEAVQNRGKGLASQTGPEFNRHLPALGEVIGWLQGLETLRKSSQWAVA